WRDADAGHGHPLRPRVDAAETLALRYLAETQADDGSWTPLWFGNEHVADETSPVFGTARVVAALKSEGPAEATLGRGLAYLRDAQRDDGSWGGGPGSEPSLEETALATAALLRHEPDGDAADAGVAAVVRAVEEGRLDAAAPIGL
ncbi:MAG: prenyltransferase/squalene oxidase repeat-containing protein, partial [Planctomycetota bacterium]